MPYLPGEGLFGNLGMGQVVDTRRAATPVRLLHLHQLDAGDRLENVPRLAVDLLAMHQVTGILVGDAQRDEARRRPKPDLHQELRRIPDRPRERGAGLPPRGIVAQLDLIFLHVGTAAGGIDDNRIESLAVEGIHGCAGQALGGFCLAGVRGQRPAADPGRRQHDVAAVHGQGERGPAVGAVKHLVLDAAGQQADAGTTGALSRRQSGQRHLARAGVAHRRKGGKLSERQNPPDAAPAQQGRETESPDGAIQPARGSQPARMGQQAVQQ